MKITIELNSETPPSPTDLKALAAYFVALAQDDAFDAPATTAVTPAPAVAVAAPPPPPAQPAAVAPPPPATVPAVPEHAPVAPPPPAAAVAPPPPPAAPAVPAPPAAQVDSTGMPWDDRIHASTKSKTKGGEWVKRRGVAPEVLAQVEASLRAGSPAAPAAAPVAPPPPSAAPAAPAAPPPPAAPDGMAILAQAVTAGNLGVAEVLDQAKIHGCNSIPDLAASPLALAAVLQHFQLV